MTTKEPASSKAPTWLIDWMREAGEHAQSHSLVLGARCGAKIHPISCEVANYLNEFDGEAGHNWRAFPTEELRHLAGDPACRNIVLAGIERSTGQASYSDLDRVTRRLARLGGAILEGQCGLDATLGVPEAFHVCLCDQEPRGHEDYHMWVNPNLFPRNSLISVIADSFLNWSSLRHPQPSGAARSPNGPDPELML